MKDKHTDSTTQRIIERGIRSDEDFWKVRDLLVETYPITPPDWNWDIRRWEGSYFYDRKVGWDSRWGKNVEKVRLWETEDGKVVGAAHPEGSSPVAHLQLHPDYRHIEEEMIAWAEERIAGPTKDGKQRKLYFFVYEYDAPRLRLMEKREYERVGEWGVIRKMRFGNKPLPQPVMAEGYTLRAVRPDDMGDCQKIADLLNAAFNRDFHNAEEFHTFAMHAPTYRSDLDLVAVAADGSFAAYVGVPYDDVNRSGIFEPVCTHPDHRKKGLAQALMFEALHRLKALGAIDVTVGTGDMIPANRLYDSVGFTEIYKGYYWCKVF